ncbi:MAG: hypothetical protein JXP34_03395, partial [Planctomycetes bacterium]|nr:hypothetical protein [Planctomycetota bacterium]
RRGARATPAAAGCPFERLGTVSDTLVFDAKRGLVRNLNAYKTVYVLRVDPASLVLSEDPTGPR